MATSSDSVGGARATAARTKSWTGLPSVTSHVERRIGDAGRAVGLEDRLERRQPRARPLRSAAEPGEEVGLDEARQDADVGLDVAAVDPHRRPVDAAHLDVLVLRPSARCWWMAVARRPCRGPRARPSRRGWRRGGCPVAHSSSTRSGPAPSRSSSASSGRQDRAVGHGPGEVGEDHRHRRCHPPTPRRAALRAVLARARPAAALRPVRAARRARRRPRRAARATRWRSRPRRRRGPAPPSRRGRRPGAPPSSVHRLPQADHAAAGGVERVGRRARVALATQRRRRAPSRPSPPRASRSSARRVGLDSSRPRWLRPRPSRRRPTPLRPIVSAAPAARSPRSGRRPTARCSRPPPPRTRPTGAAPRPDPIAGDVRGTAPRPTPPTRPRHAPCPRRRGRATAPQPRPGPCRATTAPGPRRTRGARSPPVPRVGCPGPVAHDRADVGAGQAGQPVDEGPGRRQASLEEPPAEGTSRHDHRAGGTPSATRSATGTDTLAVVPHDTIGHVRTAPAPSTSQARSPAPITTGMPARSPSSRRRSALQPRPARMSDGRSRATGR